MTIMIEMREKKTNEQNYEGVEVLLLSLLFL
jgi:hypothetical protein